MPYSVTTYLTSPRVATTPAPSCRCGLIRERVPIPGGGRQRDNRASSGGHGRAPDEIQAVRPHRYKNMSLVIPNKSAPLKSTSKAPPMDIIRWFWAITSGLYTYSAG